MWYVRWKYWFIQDTWSHHTHGSQFPSYSPSLSWVASPPWCAPCRQQIFSNSHIVGLYLGNLAVELCLIFISPVLLYILICHPTQTLAHLVIAERGKKPAPGESLSELASVGCLSVDNELTYKGWFLPCTVSCPWQGMEEGSLEDPLAWQTAAGCWGQLPWDILSWG